MTLDEAIKRMEEIAEEAQKIVDTHYFSNTVSIDEIYCDDTEIIEEQLAGYQKAAEDYSQLAEWLKELKQLREQTQEPCEDSISRQAVIETIDDCSSDGLKGIFCSYGDGERFKEYIKELPSVIPKGVTVTDFADKCRECGKQKKGKWIQEPNCWLRCSCCGSHYPHTSIYECKGSNYCPNCGAKMWEIPTGSKNKVGWSSLENVRNKVEKE